MGNYWVNDWHYGGSSTSATYTISAQGFNTTAPPRVTIEPAPPVAPLSEVERLLADVDAVCAMGR